MPDGGVGERVEFEAPRFSHLYLSDTPYSIQKSREDGERELRRLALSETEEEGAWAFSDDGLWLSIRTGARSSKAGMDADTLFFDMGQVGKRVSVYHIHPRSAVDYQADTFWKLLKGRPDIAGLDEDLQSGMREHLRSVSEIYASLPSSTDVETAADYAGLSEGCELDFRIVSPAGVTTFSIDKGHPGFGSVAEKYASLGGRISGIIAEHGYRSADVINGEMGGALTISIEPAD